MKRLSLFIFTILVMNAMAFATDFKTYENKAFSISYPADWEVTWDSNTFVNLASADEEIRFDISFNEDGPMKSELQKTVNYWVSMKEGKGYKVDQTLVKDDYALVRSIETNEDDGTKTVVVWFLVISSEPQCFCGTINSPYERANEAVSILVEMLETLKRK